MPPTHIAILGGGLTGLSSAFHLSRRFPNSRITLVEKAPRLGGWVRSERVQVKLGEDPGAGEASVLLEVGPRTLRPNGLAVLELVHLLNLTPSLITVPRTAPAARNRFLHLPGTRGLLRIPGSLPALITSPLAKVLLPAVLKETILRDNKSIRHAAIADEQDDESVDAFLTRRFGSEFAQTFGSALVHGIYAADSRILSMRAAFPSLLELEAQGKGSVVRGAIVGALGRKKSNKLTEEYDMGKVRSLMKGVSVYSFKDGMSTLVNALENALEQRDNVKIVKGDQVVQMRRATGTTGGFQVLAASGLRLSPSHLVSALPLPALGSILQDSTSSTSSIPLPPLPYLTANPSSSVTVVNLVFPSPPDAPPLHPPGFGYLVPRSLSGYDAGSQNEMGILGTVFDSCALSEQDAHNGTTPAPITKLTVMLGGPYPIPTAHMHVPAFVDKLLRELSAHLSSSHDVPSLPRPLLVRIHRHKSCIPTPTVGHEARMATLGDVVKREWGGCAQVIGAEVSGVSVGACVEAGRRVGWDW